MSHFQRVALEHASRLVNHGPTVLVTSRSADGKRRNVMAAAWSMPVEFTPPRIAIVIDKRTFTRELVSDSGAFGICIPGAALADLTYAVGSCTGRETDKFSRYGIEATPGPALGVPLIEAGCAAWLECRLIPERHTRRMPMTPASARCSPRQPTRGCSSMAAGRSATTTPPCRPSITWAQAISSTPGARYRPRR